MAASQPGSRRRRMPLAGIAMVFLSFVGRVLFASMFLISAFKEDDGFGSPSAKALEPKFNLFVKQVSTYTGMAVPHVQISTLMLATQYIRAVGGFMFIAYSSIGAFLLLVFLVFITPVMYDFYNYEMESPQFVQLFTQFLQNLALCGALMFFLGMKSSIPSTRREERQRLRQTDGGQQAEQGFLVGFGSF